MSDLLRRGDSALRMAQDAIKNYNFDDMFVNDICMLLEQAFERYLKGYLELNGHKYPKVHEIDVLLETIWVICSQHRCLVGKFGTLQ